MDNFRMAAQPDIMFVHLRIAGHKGVLQNQCPAGSNLLDERIGLKWATVEPKVTYPDKRLFG
jgi:hypothetical protein